MKGEYGCTQEGRQQLSRAGNRWDTPTGQSLDNVR